MARKAIIIDKSKCNSCGRCIPKCHEGAIKLVNGVPSIVAGLCNGVGSCIKQCPRGAIVVVRDDHRIKPSRYISPKERTCPKMPQCASLRQWPVQLQLASPEAPFLAQAHLLIASDCVPASFAAFHTDLLMGKALLLGCPKFGDLKLYKQKLTQIIRANHLKSITYARMEVPCCLALKPLIKQAIAASKKKIPFHEVVISVKGVKL